MTGNTVLLGLAIAGPGRSRVVHAGLALAAFVAGEFLGAFVLLRLHHPHASADLRIGTSLEFPFTVLFTVLWILFPSGGPAWVVPVMIAAGAGALGIQSAAARRLRVFGAETTFITGTITTGDLIFSREKGSGRPN